MTVTKLRENHTGKDTINEVRPFQNLHFWLHNCDLGVYVQGTIDQNQMLYHFFGYVYIYIPDMEKQY